VSQPSGPRASAGQQFAAYYVLIALGIGTLLVLVWVRGQLGGILACVAGLLLACIGAAPLLGAYARRQQGRAAHLSGRTATWGTLLVVLGLALTALGVVLLVSS
jgi:hypothetical protein